jgi:uncharacterized protein YfaS (alpha-2-macroglobulin family)
MKRSPIRIGVLLFMLLSLACSLSLPGMGPRPTPQPTPTPIIPLPPALVETVPPSGSELSLDGSLTFYFNQPMEKDISFDGLPEGTFSWVDDATLQFTPAKPFMPAKDVEVTLLAAKATIGLELPAQVKLHFRTADYLRLTQFLPTGTEDVTATSAVVASFNQPIVPLGASPSALPVAFTLTPAVNGKGEWINTSTYIFYPDPALAGGTSYTATLNSALTGTSDTPLDTNSKQSWTFSVARPRIISVEPAPDKPLPLDPTIKITFNQPMALNSIGSAFSLVAGSGGIVDGQISWEQNDTVLLFKPSGLLARGSTYTLLLDAATAKGLGGSPLIDGLSLNFNTFPDFAVLDTNPVTGGEKQLNKLPTITFAAPIAGKADVDKLVTISPELSGGGALMSGNTITVHGQFDPATLYTVTVSQDLADRWGQSLGRKFVYQFRTPPAQPSLNVPYFTGKTFFVLPDKPLLGMQATNISAVKFFTAPLPLGDYFKLTGAGGYDFQRAYKAAKLLTWSFPLQLKPNRNTTVKIPLTPNGGPLAPGVYYLLLQTPEGTNNMISNPYFAVASNVNLTLKIGARDALVWAIDQRTQKPVSDEVVSLFDIEGNLVIYGRTDANGLWYTSLQENPKPYQGYYAVMGQPGDENFGMAVSTWDDGIEPYSFNVSMAWQGTHTEVYMYSDRPIYRPGQTVYFRGVVRQAFNGRYSKPEIQDVKLTLTNDQGKAVQDFSLALSEFGTFDGQYMLPDGAPPGYYKLGNSDLQAYLYFSVADYRKPEINLSVAVTPDEARLGKPLRGQVNAQYFFGSPVNNLPLHWTLYQTPNYFYLPGYSTGAWSYHWGADYWGDYESAGYFGPSLAAGDTMTASDGTATIDLPEISPDDAGRLTLEVTAQDESGYSVSAHTTALIHPENFYIGVRPAQWVGQAGSAMNFEIVTVDWMKAPSPSVALKAVFSQVDFEVDQKPTLTQVVESNLTTDSGGKARIEFTPPKAGSYLLELSGGDALTQVLIWVGGKDQAVWPRLPMQHLQLVADRDSFRPGDVAQVFIPNPFGVETPTLVTVERGVILRSQVLTLGAAGSSVAIPLNDDSAPNVYVSAVVLGTDPDFRQGYLNLKVEPEKQTLKVELTSNPVRSAPGGEVSFGVRITDSAGRPVKGEFSLAVVDEAALALADPNSQDILPAFYGVQSLGIRTGLSLAVYAQRYLPFEGGKGGGGGGGEADVVVRENFPDTAYWNATIVTDMDGRASVKVKLPDNLTTWHVEVRGLTEDTRVGQAVSEVVSTKDLLIRPVTPRFFVAGDHVALAAVVNNNTGEKMQATVTLQASGFSLDDPASAMRNVNIPAHGRVRVEWPGTVQTVDKAEFIFGVDGGGMQDATRPNDGTIPILRYTAPQMFSTAGLLSEAGSRKEVVSLPRTFSPTGGGLDIELSPSLAATILGSLDVLEPPERTWSSAETLSYVLPNLETFRTLQDAGLDAPELKARLDATLNPGIESLIGGQNTDGGWGWGANKSDALVSAYALFGLHRAAEAGIEVPSDVIQKGRDYLQSARPYLGGGEIPNWQLNESVFFAHVLDQTGGVDSYIVEALYDSRDHLNPWAQALLALTLESVSHGDPRSRELLSNLESNAIRTSTGVHWESEKSWRIPATPLFTTALVAYVLAQRDPATPVLADAVRYLAMNRGASGGWGSRFETAWVILALDAVMKGSGELQANFAFDAVLNNTKMVEGQAAGPQTLTPVTASVPVTNLSVTLPNSLVVDRGEGAGKLYYRVALKVDRPVESVQPLKAGMEVGRAYYDAECEKDCPPLTSVELTSGKKVKVRVTLIAPNDVYYLVLDDFIPAGSEILNTTLKTAQQGEGSGTDVRVTYDPSNPFSSGWGWWLFDQPQIYADHITWTANYLTAGTYELTYTIIPLQAGEYRVLPTHVWQYYFPEVQATSGGLVFEIKP